jgi:hypothetical protein
MVRFSYLRIDALMREPSIVYSFLALEITGVWGFVYRPVLQSID